MSVHRAITAHANRQHRIVRSFIALDEQREEAIERAIAQAKRGEEVSVSEINEITAKMNELAKQGIVPRRKFVTVDMVLDYVNKKQN